MMHKTCSINYGYLADLQKTLPTTDLNKKNFHLIKYLLATFLFFLSFQSVLVNFFSLGSDNIGGGLLIHTNRLPSKQADRWRSHQLQESYLCWKISGEILRFIHLVIIGVRNYQSYLLVSKINHRCVPMVYSLTTWASYQLRKIAGCACAGNASNVFPATDFKGNRKLAILACIEARAWRTCRYAC